MDLQAKRQFPWLQLARALASAAVIWQAAVITMEPAWGHGICIDHRDLLANYQPRDIEIPPWFLASTHAES
ncbi:unnamed protein product [Clonostachys solani]|uniref:Uncharacterized protein n=1 Tax=Clonostachys solani TaxID=160281 RepID=A0A9P0EKC1_9HYPO|nr:unnamed protein product [Clonostachys solani]